MKSRGIFSCLCHSLDCMEEEMHSLCGLFRKKCRRCDADRQPHGVKKPCISLLKCDNRAEKCEKCD